MHEKGSQGVHETTWGNFTRIRFTRPRFKKLYRGAERRHWAQEIREQLILVLSKDGGHLGPNLGVVRADAWPMHYVFNTPSTGLCLM